MKPSVLALGFFDGVHSGHGALLKKVRIIADELRVQAAAITFDRHPASFLTGRKTPLLNTVAERVELMTRLYEMDEVHVLPFDDTLSRMPWQAFAQMLRDEFCARHLVCGHDYRFGAKGEGDAQKLAQFCRENGIGFDVIEQVCLNEMPISSTNIRALLTSGDVSRAERFLGHPHLLGGIVVDGRKIGRTLSIPTANLQICEDVILPRLGVYAAEAFFDGERHAAVVNIGTRPTFDGQTVTVEPWLLDFAGDLYGKRVTLALYEYLREEKKFESKEALCEQVRLNAQTAREIIKQRGECR